MGAPSSGDGVATAALAVATSLRTINRGIALLLGVALLLTAVFVVVEITLRRANASFGGSDEISGYVMAALSSWGLAYALVERAHIRIDLARIRLAPIGRALADLFAHLVLAGTVVVIAAYAWPVLEKTIARGSLANTPLETPLWIPQSVWFAGWAWFAITACVLVLCALACLFARDVDGAEALIGTEAEAAPAKGAPAPGTPGEGGAR